MEAPRSKPRAVARFVPIAPSKARRVVDLIRGLPAERAVDVLRFAPQAASEPVRKVLESAMANAENNLQLDRGTLRVARAYVDGGPTASGGGLAPRAGQVRCTSAAATSPWSSSRSRSRGRHQGGQEDREEARQKTSEEGQANRRAR